MEYRLLRIWGQERETAGCSVRMALQGSLHALTAQYALQAFSQLETS